MRGVGVQVAKTRLLRQERDEQARRQIAMVAEAVMMMVVVIVLTYGRSAWCGPLWDVWMELLCVLMVEIVVVGDGGCEWMREM